MATVVPSPLPHRTKVCKTVPYACPDVGPARTQLLALDQYRQYQAHRAAQQSLTIEEPTPTVNERAAKLIERLVRVDGLGSLE